MTDFFSQKIREGQIFEEFTSGNFSRKDLYHDQENLLNLLLSF